MRSNLSRTLASTLFFLLLFGLPWMQGPALGQTTLTAITVDGANSSGNGIPGYDYDTTPPPDGAWKVWVVPGGQLSGSFLNGPTATNAGISIPLQPGTYTYTVFTNHNFLFSGTVPEARYGSLNLFFDGSQTPGISVYAPTKTSVNTFPPFLPIPAGSGTRYPTGAYGPGAGTLTFTDGGQFVTLTNFWYAAAGVYGLDRVAPASTSPDGLLDNISQFTITVSGAQSVSPGSDGTGLLKITPGVPHYEADIDINGYVLDWRVVFPLTLRNTGGTSLYEPTLTYGQYGTSLYGKAVYAPLPGDLMPVNNFNPQPLNPGTPLGEMPPGTTITTEVAFLYPFPTYPFSSGQTKPPVPLSLSGYAIIQPPLPGGSFLGRQTQQFSLSLRGVPAPTY